MNGISFSTLKDCYLGPVYEIEQLCFKDPWSLQSFLKELSNPMAYYVVAIIGERVVAYGGFWHIVDEGHITNIAVHPDFRQKGIGKALLDKMIERARELDISRLTLEVRRGNKAARSLYEGKGFEYSGIRPRYYADGEDAAIYWLELT